MAILFFLASVLCLDANAQSTDFTFQGHLTDNGDLANGLYDFRFELFDADTNGASLGIGTRPATEVTNGIFTVTLGFGAGFDDGEDRWLEIGVRTNGGGAYTTVIPRRRVTSAPYAITSKNLSGVLPSAGLSGTYSEGVDLVNVANQISGTFSGDGAGLTGIHSLDAADGNPADALWVNNPGNVGIGTVSPDNTLHVHKGSAGAVAGNANAPLVVENAGTCWVSILSPAANERGVLFGDDVGGSATGGIVFNNADTTNGLQFRVNGNSTRMVIDAEGDVGIGTTGPVSPLHVAGVIRSDTEVNVGTTVQIRATESGTDGADLLLRDAMGLITINLDAGRLEGGSTLFMANGNGVTTVSIDSDQTDAAYMSLMKADGSEGIVLDADNAIGGSLVAAQIMRITGGADIAEPFRISGESPRPGMVVSIDPSQPGQLTLSHAAYDRKVAGVISGAGGVHTGLMLGQAGSLASGDHPVALSGRVYCWCDSVNGQIEPGDLLTTSTVPGHAMKVTDFDLSSGAVVGKAMTRLDSGRGLVLVLVNLH
jgi:hypothetical protein